jgi:hypothetical protein
MTDDDKQKAMAMGAVQIVKGLLIAKFALRVSLTYHHSACLHYLHCWTLAHSC